MKSIYLQLRNAIQKIRRELFGEHYINLQDFIDWFEQLSAIPADEDEPFIFQYEHKMTGTVKPNPQKLTESSFTFNCLLSTKRLLANGVNTTLIHADSTYKLNWEGHPIEVFGTTDKLKAFHPIAIGFSTNETEADYQFCFRTIDESLRKFFNVNPKFQALISDAAAAIKNGFKAVYPDQDIIQCYFHVTLNVKKSNRFKKADNKALVLQDLGKLQLSASKEIFAVASQLFLKKWQQKEPDFISYFEKQWLCERNVNWYEGAKQQCPKTNNALESFNAKIKNDFHFREKSTMPVFQNKMIAMLRRLSCEYRDRVKEVKNKIVIGKKDWFSGYEWAKSNTQVREQKSNLKVTYFLSEIEDVVGKKALEEYNKKKWKTFSDFDQQTSTIRAVSFDEVPNPQNPEQWRNATCTCREYLKNYICQHVIGVCLRFDLSKCQII